MSAVPASLRPIAARVEARLDQLLAVERDRWVAVDPDLAAPIDAIRALVGSGGKRLRPAFCQWGFVGAGGDPADEAWVDAGAAFELLHAFALFHDDVMDGSATRRGARTTHLAFADLHERSGWIGEARRFGEGVAILVGDLAFVYADQLMAHASPAAWAMWNELRIELNVGQYLDILGTVRSERRRDVTERICRFKSAKYTVERPLHLGALLADADRGTSMLPGLSAYGLPLGDAFQLRDDVLGVFGDESVTGKPVGDDLREGKPTPMMALAHEAATPSQRQVLATVGCADLDADAVAAIQQVLIDTGALASVEARIDRLAVSAVGALADVALDAPAGQALEELARFVVLRQS